MCASTDNRYIWSLVHYEGEPYPQSQATLSIPTAGHLAQDQDGRIRIATDYERLASLSSDESARWAPQLCAQGGTVPAKFTSDVAPTVGLWSRRDRAKAIPVPLYVSGRRVRRWPLGECDGTPRSSEEFLALLSEATQLAEKLCQAYMGGPAWTSPPPPDSIAEIMRPLVGPACPSSAELRQSLAVKVVGRTSNPDHAVPMLALGVLDHCEELLWAGGRKDECADFSSALQEELRELFELLDD